MWVNIKIILLLSESCLAYHDRQTSRYHSLMHVYWSHQVLSGWTFWPNEEDLSSVRYDTLNTNG